MGGLGGELQSGSGIRVHDDDDEAPADADDVDEIPPASEVEMRPRHRTTRTGVT